MMIVAPLLRRLVGFVRKWNDRRGGVPAVPKFARLELLGLSQRILPAVTLLKAPFNGIGVPAPVNGNTPPAPNPSVAVGPNHIVETVQRSQFQGFYAVYRKSDGASLQQTQSLSTLGGMFGAEPIVIYDKMVGRFVIVSLENSSDGASVYLAVSDSSDPTAGFTERQNYILRPSSGFAGVNGSGLKIGYNREAYVLSLFDDDANETQILSINKGQVTDRNVNTRGNLDTPR